MERYAICCETPFQLLNAFNYTLNHDHKNIEIDLYIRKDFWLDIELINRVKNSSVFDRVFIFEYRKNDLLSDNKIRFVKIERTFFPGWYINKRLLNGKAYRNYSCIFVAFVQPFEYGLIHVNRDSELVYFDDGLASYTNNFPSEGFGRSRKILKALGQDVNIYRPEVLYINNKEFCSEAITNNIKEFFPLKSAGPDFWQKIDYVFEYSNSGLYVKNKLVFLSMPNDLNRIEFSERVTRIISILNKRNCLIRPHPRDNRSFGDGISIDNHNDLWELVCLRQISDDNCLISIFSTAQFTPKMLYNKEPYLVFLYKLFSDFFEESDRMSGMIDVIRSHYSNPSKIIVVESFEELVDILDSMGLDNEH